MEMSIDSELSRIDAAWMGLQLDYVHFESTGVMTLVPPYDVVEARRRPRPRPCTPASRHTLATTCAPWHALA